MFFSALFNGFQMYGMRRDGWYGRSGSVMIINIMVGMMITGLIIGMLYGIYMAIWGVYDEFY